jgi:hypothetical protein
MIRGRGSRVRESDDGRGTVDILTCELTFALYAVCRYTFGFDQRQGTLHPQLNGVGGWYHGTCIRPCIA